MRRSERRSETTARGGNLVSDSCEVLSDGRVARIQIDGDLGPADVESLILLLMGARARMVPRRLPIMFAASRIIAGDAARVTSDGITAVHHPGIGWVGARADVTAAA